MNLMGEHPINGLSDIKWSVEHRPRIVLYSQPGIGKTTLGSRADSPIFIPTKEGFGKIKTKQFPLCTTYIDVINCLESLKAEKHDYKTLVLDDLTHMEPLIWDRTVYITPGETLIDTNEKGKEFTFHRGYKRAVNVWKELLAGFDWLCEKKGMAIILLAHSETETFSNPTGDDYDYYTIGVQKYAQPVIYAWADAVLYADIKTFVVTKASKKGTVARATSTGERIMYTEKNAAFQAKNRYGLPAEMPLTWEPFAETKTKTKASK